MQWKIDLAKRDKEALQKEEWAREAQEQKEEHARVAQEIRDAAFREEMAKQSEEQRVWEAQRQRQHFLAQNLPKYDGHEQLDTFLQWFEEILTGEGVPMEQWVQLLTRALTGKPATLLTTVLSLEVKASYPLTKETLLASVCLSFHHYVDELFTLNKANDTTPEMALHHSSTVAKFIFKDGNTLDDAIWTITKLHTLRQYTPECVQTVLKQDPCKPHELSTAIRYFEQLHGDSTQVKLNRRPIASYPERHPLLHNSPNPIPRPQPKPQNWSNNTGQQGWSDGTWQLREYPMICFACGQPGHKASYCQAKKQNPNKDLAMANIRKVGKNYN